MAIMLAGVEYPELDTGIQVPIIENNTKIDNSVNMVSVTSNIKIDNSIEVPNLKIDENYIDNRVPNPIPDIVNTNIPPTVTPELQAFPQEINIPQIDIGNNTYSSRLTIYWSKFDEEHWTSFLPGAQGNEELIVENTYTRFAPMDTIDSYLPVFNEDYLRALNTQQQNDKNRRNGWDEQFYNRMNNVGEAVFKYLHGAIYSIKYKPDPNLPPHMWEVRGGNAVQNKIDKINDEIGNFTDLSSTSNSNLWGDVPTGKKVHTQDRGAVGWEQIDFSQIDPILAANGFIKVGNPTRPDLNMQKLMIKEGSNWKWAKYIIHTPNYEDYPRWEEIDWGRSTPSERSIIAQAANANDLSGAYSSLAEQDAERGDTFMADAMSRHAVEQANRAIHLGNSIIKRPDLSLRKTNQIDVMSTQYNFDNPFVISDKNGLQMAEAHSSEGPGGTINHISNYENNHSAMVQGFQIPNRSVDFLMSSGSDFLKNMFDSAIVFRGPNNNDFQQLSSVPAYRTDPTIFKDIGVTFQHLTNGKDESVLMVRTSGIEIPQKESDVFHTKWVGGRTITKVKSKLNYNRTTNLKMLLDEPLYIRMFFNYLSGTSRAIDGLGKYPKGFYPGHLLSNYKIDIFIKHEALLNYPYLEAMKRAWRKDNNGNGSLLGLAELYPDEYPIWWFQDVKFMGEGNGLTYNRENTAITEFSVPFIFRDCIKVDRSRKIAVRADPFINLKPDGTAEGTFSDTATFEQSDQRWRNRTNFWANTVK